MMPSWPQILICVVIIAIVFGTKRVTGLMKDAGKELGDFRKAIKEDEDKTNVS